MSWLGPCRVKCQPHLSMQRFRCVALKCSYTHICTQSVLCQGFGKKLFVRQMLFGNRRQLCEPILFRLPGGRTPRLQDGCRSTATFRNDQAARTVLAFMASGKGTSQPVPRDRPPRQWADRRRESGGARCAGEPSAGMGEGCAGVRHRSRVRNLAKRVSALSQRNHQSYGKAHR